MINKATDYLALLHFKTWLKKASTYAENFKIADESVILDEEAPVFAFLFPSDSHLPIFFICRSGDELNWLNETDLGAIIIWLLGAAFIHKGLRIHKDNIKPGHFWNILRTRSHWEPFGSEPIKGNR